MTGTDVSPELSLRCPGCLEEPELHECARPWADDTQGAVKHPQNNGSDMSIKEYVMLLDPKCQNHQDEKAVKTEGGSKLQYC